MKTEQGNMPEDNVGVGAPFVWVIGKCFPEKVTFELRPELRSQLREDLGGIFYAE